MREGDGGEMPLPRVVVERLAPKEAKKTLLPCATSSMPPPGSRSFRFIPINAVAAEDDEEADEDDGDDDDGKPLPEEEDMGQCKEIKGGWTSMVHQNVPPSCIQGWDVAILRAKDISER